MSEETNYEKISTMVNIRKTIGEKKFNVQKSAANPTQWNMWLQMS